VSLPDFTVCLVTRGDVDLAPILESFRPFGAYRIVVWDNSVEVDLAVLGRYAAASRAETELVYVQDDDVVLPVESIMELFKAWRPGHLVANMPERFRHDFYVDHCLVGFGAVFERSLIEAAFGRVLRHRGGDNWDTWFHRTCDVAFTGQVSRILVDVPYVELDYASAPGRMWKQPEHVGERQRMLDLVRSLR
jgi:hypothetical protein